MIGPRQMGAGTPDSSSQNYPSSYPYPNRAHKNAGDAPRTPAQQLIDQYERFSTPPPCTSTRTKSTYRRQYISNSKSLQTSDASQPRSDFMDQENGKKHGLGLLKKEGRSPIRQSLRNILSVFKKVHAESKGKRRLDDKLGVPYSSMASAGNGRDQEDSEPPEVLARAQNKAAQHSGSSLAPPRKRMTGSLLYLSHATQLLSPHIPGPLMWTTCSVTIDSNKLVVSSITGDIESTVHEISLLRCTDIRSLAATQLNMEEAQLLDRVPGGEQMRAFEIMFEGRKREKFAAKSVRERAGWISAIWDAILPGNYAVVQEQPPAPSKDVRHDIVQEEPAVLVTAPNDSVIPRSIPVKSPRPMPLPQMSPLLTSHSERSLPPLPPPSHLPPPTSKILDASESKPNLPTLHLDLSNLQGPISPSIYPPTSLAPSPAASTDLLSPSTYSTTYTSGSYFMASPTSMTATSASYSSNRPSVANLSHLSVVRHRLAQIERSHSRLSDQSHATNMTLPLPSPTSTSGWAKREALFYNGPKSPSKLRPATPAEDTPVIVPEPYNVRSVCKQIKDVPPNVSLNTPESKSGATNEDIRKLSKGLADIKGVIGGESGHPTVHQMVLALEHHARSEKKALCNIQDGLNALGERVSDAVGSVPRVDPNITAVQIDSSAMLDSNAQVLKAVKEVKDRLVVDFPVFANKLDDLQKSQERTWLAKTSKLKNIASLAHEPKTTAVDLKPVLEKLEEIRALCNSAKGVQPKADENIEITQQVDKILTLIQEDSNKQILISQQQADSVRYLNELNSWLEAFVNNGTSQIQGMSANLERICGELGFSERANVPNSQSGPRTSLVNDIRHLVAGMKARDQNFTSLQGAVHSLLEILTASQTQKGADTQAIAGLMNQQRHDQEMLFRAFTNEISGEIKGERLRFVEAMKEATAINVQLHVEQFKQELGREVMIMTEEVGRLHREKLNVENQISDLFSFYSKHTKGEKPLRVIQENIVLPDTRRAHDKARLNLPRSHPHRQLPYPHPHQ